MDQQLLSFRHQLAQELSQAEGEYRKLQAKIAAWREKIAAIDTLTGNSQAAVNADDKPESEDAEDDGIFTPREAYWRPILEALVEMGGRGKRQKVLDAVEVKMKGILTQADYGNLPKSGWKRWSNRVAWQISDMRQKGYVKKNSPRGIWEITDAGRKWLDDIS